MNWTAELLDRFVESQIFFPDPLLICTPGDVGLRYEDVRMETEDGVILHGWFVPAAEPVGLMLFCHGNAGNISHRVDNIQRLNAVGVSVLIFDYRGYGRSEGRISEAGFYLDCDAAYRIAVERAKQAGLPLVIFGRSLGGIGAVHLASRFPSSGVILESTFTNLAAMAREHFPLPVPIGLLRDRLNALDRVGSISVPLLFFHGDLGEIVPLHLGQELYEAARPPKDFVVIPSAGHNDTYLIGGSRYFARISEFVKGLAAIRPEG